ncbi:cadmium resistance transporter [Kitasatospora kifunensis]|uniref:Cadmium resistance protein CadD (Predicted permease) n=1 Tax=Kitasatospora kifunensis TaxID=58351 RepID=A0A7W7VZ97_KITKI|nr:cadmium resistance transporter [Kitasatospora kifunensis]MBB4927509.1 cadmium resistance protein CadD (predicted permease) [Kitasatospora kifunensis]
MTGSLLATAAVAFLGTTIDDLIILTALFMACRTSGRPRVSAIIAGQYTGFAAVLGLALLAAAGLQLLPERWVGLLGLVPIGFGVCGLWRLRDSPPHAPPLMAATAPRIAIIVFAGGADNLSVFTPLFRTLHPGGSLLATALFLAMIGLWCGAGALLGTHPAVVAALGRVRHWLIPAVFITVGVLILIASGMADGS